jgi:hypothetical protein
MTKVILLDQLHLSVLAPRRLPAAEYDAMSRTVDSLGFRRRLGRAVRALCRAYPALAKAKVRVSR